MYFIKDHAESVITYAEITKNCGSKTMLKENDINHFVGRQKRFIKVPCVCGHQFIMLLHDCHLICIRQTIFVKFVKNTKATLITAETQTDKHKYKRNFTAKP